MSRLRTACLSLAAMAVISLVLISILSQDIQGMEDKISGKQRRKRSDDFGESKAVTTKRPRKPLEDQMVMGSKRFQLYDGDKMNYKEAGTFCKKEGGKLAQAANMDEMRGLQILLMKSQVLGRDIWIGADKKEWKQHAFKMQRKPMFGPDPALFGGGGPTEMCPALSFSTRSLFPVSCNTDLPLICEFDKNMKPKKTNKKATTGKPKLRTQQPPIIITVRPKRSSHVEMRRKRDLVATTTSMDALSSTEKNEEGLSTTTEGSAIEVFDGEEVGDDVTGGAEKSIEEDHRIGFRPHVEQEMSPGRQFQVKLSASLRVETVDDNDISSTMDPDQFMVNLIDEQTTNLTAIELESQGQLSTSPQPRFAMLAEGVEEIVGNELEPLVAENSTADGFAFEEFMDSGFYSTPDLPTSGSFRVQANTSSEQDDVQLTPATVEEGSDSKRQPRNVTAHMMNVNGTTGQTGGPFRDFSRVQNIGAGDSETTQRTGDDANESTSFQSTERILDESSTRSVDEATMSPVESSSYSSVDSAFDENAHGNVTHTSA